MKTKNININKEIIALFSGQSNIITTPKLYIQLTNNHSLAVVLNQCVFWSNKSNLKNGWFYKKYQEWFDEIHIPERTLRRYFDKLEKMGLISTRVKKIKGKNTKIIYTHIDIIYESITNMLNEDCPIRPTWPDGSEIDQNTCTKVAPTGQLGRIETATLADYTLYTEKHIQEITTTEKQKPLSSSFFVQKQRQKCLKAKPSFDFRSDELFLEHCEHHIKNNSIETLSFYQRVTGLCILIEKLNSQGFIFESNNFVDKREIEIKKRNSEEINLRRSYHEYVKRIQQDKFLKIPSGDKEMLTFEDFIKTRSANDADKGRMQA